MKLKLFKVGVMWLVAAVVLTAANSRADELISVDKALQKIYPKMTTSQKKRITLPPEAIVLIEEEADITFGVSHKSFVHVYTVYQNSTIIGYGFEDTVIGKWGPIHYLVGLNPQGQIIRSMVLDYQEIRGKPIAKKRFQRQYRGKSIDDPVRLRRDIDGISGASISSRSFTDGVRKILHIFRHIQSQ